MGFQKKSEKSAMCTVPKPHQPPQGVYFDTLIVMYQNEKYLIRFYMFINLMIYVYKYNRMKRKFQCLCVINLYKLVSSIIHQFISSPPFHQFIISLPIHQFISSSVHQFISSSIHQFIINH